MGLHRAGVARLSTVRYPEGGRRRDELHLRELADFETPGGSGRTDGLVPRLSREIDDSEAVAAARQCASQFPQEGPTVGAARPPPNPAQA